ncbi:MAG: hypothetical protein ACP5IM_07875 [Candidatus Bathyarchaeia archaeon]
MGMEPWRKPQMEKPGAEASSSAHLQWWYMRFCKNRPRHASSAPGIKVNGDTNHKRERNVMPQRAVSKETAKNGRNHKVDLAFVSQKTVGGRGR